MADHLPQAFALQAFSEETLAKSTSGGAFTLLSDAILARGGVVYGAAFGPDMRVAHRRATTKGGRDAMCGAKYVDSALGTTFLQVRRDLAAGRAVLFSGLPCQVDALHRALEGADTTNLLTLDLLCYGAGDPAVWDAFVTCLQHRYGPLAAFSFRYKPLGWRGAQVHAVFQSGRVLSNTRLVRAYTALYFGNLIMRGRCATCRYASLRRCGDISLGDFWGIEQIGRLSGLHDEAGTSLVLANTEKGLGMVAGIMPQAYAAQVAIDECIQPCLKRPTAPSPERAAFYRAFSRRGIRYCIRRYTRPRLWQLPGRGLRAIMRRL